MIQDWKSIKGDGTSRKNDETNFEPEFEIPARYEGNFVRK